MVGASAGLGRRPLPPQGGGASAQCAAGVRAGVEVPAVHRRRRRLVAVRRAASWARVFDSLLAPLTPTLSPLRGEREWSPAAVSGRRGPG